MSLLLYTIALSVLYFFCLFLKFCWKVCSNSTLIPVDTTTHSLETIRLLLQANWSAQCCQMYRFIGTCTDFWSVYKIFTKIDLEDKYGFFIYFKKNWNSHAAMPKAESKTAKVMIQTRESSQYRHCYYCRMCLCFLFNFDFLIWLDY